MESAFSVSELVKYVFFLLISAGVLWIVKAIPQLRDDVRQMKQVLMGVNGDNGLRSDVHHHKKELQDIRERHIKEDTVTEIEYELAEGNRRRLRDKMTEKKKPNHHHGDA